MPGQQSINTDAPTNGILTIYGVDYRRQEVLRLPRPAGLPAISFGGFDWRRQRKKLLSQLTVSERPPAGAVSPFNRGHFANVRYWACAVQRRRFPVGENPTRQPLQPEAIGAVMEG